MHEIIKCFENHKKVTIDKKNRIKYVLGCANIGTQNRPQNDTNKKNEEYISPFNSVVFSRI